jgi:hypothetical protein
MNILNIVPWPEFSVDLLFSKASDLKHSSFQLRAYKESIGPLKEVAYWVPEKFHVRRKARNFAQSGGHHDDPLGLSVERSESKISEAELREFFGEDKTSEIGSENFDPGESFLKVSFSSWAKRASCLS